MPLVTKAKNIIPIVIVTDEHYIIHLAALLKSIEINHKTSEKIAVYIIADGVKKSSKAKIQTSIDTAMISIQWSEMREVIPSGVKLPLDRTSYPVTIYLRLFIQYIVPADTNKALFLDVDMIMLADVSNLYNHNLGENIIAAVQDSRLLTFDNDWGGIFNYKELGFTPKTKYFNTGIIIFNMQKWTADNYAQKVLKCIDDNIGFANYPDQYGFNVIMANKWLELSSNWNYFASGEDEKPYLIHFISRKPFYTSYSYNPKYQQIFYNYLKLTEWRHAKPIGEISRYGKKISNIWVKLKKKLGFVYFAVI